MVDLKQIWLNADFVLHWFLTALATVVISVIALFLYMGGQSNTLVASQVSCAVGGSQYGTERITISLDCLNGDVTTKSEITGAEIVANVLSKHASTIQCDLYADKSVFGCKVP